MVSVLAPLAYVAFLVGSLVIFSKVYRRRQAVKNAHEPWFGPHHARDLYFSLLSMDPPPARPVLIAALIRRAMTDVQRIMEIRENKMALQNLSTKGQIGDDTWNEILEAEKELDSEIYEVVQEANTFKQGWGQFIFAHAGDEVQHEKNKKWWEEIEEEKRKLSEKYSQPAPLITAPPLLGISASNPKKRVLPSSTPSNANIGGSGTPSSKPGTPVPQRVLQSNGTPQQQQQPGGPIIGPNGQQLTPAQIQQAAIMQISAVIRQQNPNLTPAQAQQAAAQLIQQQQMQQMQAQQQAQAQSQATINGNGSTAAANGSSTTTPAGTPSKPSAARTTSSPQGPPKTPAAMLRQASTISTVSAGGGSSIAGDSSDEGDDAGSSAGIGSTTTSPRKTPNKKGKKKGKGKKK